MSEREGESVPKTEHTPEPWSLEVREAGIWTKGPTGENIALVMFPGRSIGHVNAKRIQVCVNACAGISTEELEAGAVESLVEALRAAVEQLQMVNAIYAATEGDSEVTQAIVDRGLASLAKAGKR